MGKDNMTSRDLLGLVRKHSKMNEDVEQEAGASTLSDVELEDEKNRFKEGVGSTAEFNGFKIYESNIQWSGVLPVENIAWSFSLDNNDGCYITANTLQLTTETLERINKLSAYYDVWREYWMKEVNA